MIFDIMDLLQFPYEYCSRDNNYLIMLTDYFFEEDNYEFYLENSNYLYFYFLSQVINKTKKHELKAGFFEALLIYYFLTNNADINNFDSTLDYIIKNRRYLSTYFQQNYVDGHGEDFFDIIMSKILSQENNKTIK